MRSRIARWMDTRWRWLTMLLGILLGSLGACAKLPDVSLFAGATDELAAAIRSAGPVVADEVDRMDDGAALAESLRQQWGERNAAIEGVVAYSRALVEIVGAAHNSGEAVVALAQRLESLAHATGLVAPGSSIGGGVVTDTARFVWAQVQLARGAASLEEALAAAQPVVDRAAEHMRADLRDLDMIVRAAAEHQLALIDAAPDVNIAHETAAALAEAKRTLMAGIAARAADDAAAPIEPADLRSLADIDAVLVSNVRVLDAAAQAGNTIESREHAARRLLAACGDAIDDWSRAHRSLVDAMHARRPVDVESLTAAALEIRELVRKAGAR